MKHTVLYMSTTFIFFFFFLLSVLTQFKRQVLLLFRKMLDEVSGNEEHTRQTRTHTRNSRHTLILRGKINILETKGHFNLQGASAGFDNHIGQIALFDDVRRLVRVENGQRREARRCAAGRQVRTGFARHPIPR